MAVEVYAKVTLAAVSGLPEDAVVNDLAFDVVGTGGSTLPDIADSIESFYNTANLTRPIANYFGLTLSRVANACSIDFYDVSAHLDGSAAGSPVATSAFTLGAGEADDPWPSEVACKLSIIADGWELVPETAVDPGPPVVRSRPRARYRGGFYLGPLTGLSGTTDGNGEQRPNLAFRQDIEAAAFRFMDERAADFCIWSRADEVFRLVAPGGLWTVDNAFDTIRSRGPAATARFTVWP